MKAFNFLLSLIFVCSIVSCGTSSKQNNGEVTRQQLNKIFEDYRSFQYYSYPEYATYQGIHDYNDRLSNQSNASYDQYMDSIKSFKKTVLAIDKASLSSNDQLNYDLFLYKLTEEIMQYELEIEKYLMFTQQQGYHIYFPQITGYQPFETENDIENYIKRLQQFKTEAGHLIEGLKEGQSKGIVLSCNITTQVLAQLEGFVNTSAEASPLYTVIEKSEVAKSNEAAIKLAIEESVQPGYQALYDYYKNEYHPNCRTEIGISSVNGGKPYYEYLVKKYTTSDLTPDEVFNIGQSEVARIETEMKKVQEELGFSNLSKLDFFTALRTNPDFYFTEKEDLLNGFRAILDTMDTKLPQLFGKLPKTPYDLKEIEEYRAVAAPAAYYYNAPEDGSRPGYFYVNTYNLSARPKFTMTALALHEAVPGHHLQIALEKEMDDVPWFRTTMGVTAFIEGWGLYAEYLGYETDMYKDPLQKLGALTFEMWRACRLVVDAGMHYKGWTREEAINYLKENLPITEPDIISEIDRYIAMPGQALAYKIGELKLKALRANAEKQLGDKFDVKSFHDAILENGSLPLSILESNIDEWIKNNQ
ncbi:MAG: DUF885 domain-containing protein [Chitinophagales bacterium]